jgi:hypothetical protein
MAVYNVSIAEAGAAADSPSASAVFASSIVEAATIHATDLYSSAGSTFNETVSEAGSAADTQNGVDFSGSILIEAGSAVDTITALISTADSIIEAGFAQDVLDGGNEFLYFDRVKYYTSAIGASPTLVVVAPVVRFQTPAAAGTLEGNICSILIEQGNDWETDLGVYSAVGNYFSRTFRASSTGAMLNLNGTATVAIVEESIELNYRTPATPGLYGDANDIAQFTIDERGRVIQAANIPLSVSGLMGLMGPPGPDGDDPDDPPVVPGPTGAVGATGATGATGPAGSVTYEWNPDDCYWAGIIIGAQDGRSIYNNFASGGGASVRGSASHSSGKFYFEFIVGVVSGVYPGCGVGDSSASLTNFAGSDTHAWAMYADGNARHNSATTAGSSYAAGDIIGVAVDFTASTGSIKFLKNNVSNVTYGSLTLGTMFPIGSMPATAALGRGKLSLAAAEQTYSPPAGYSTWS